MLIDCCKTIMHRLINSAGSCMWSIPTQSHGFPATLQPQPLGFIQHYTQPCRVQLIQSTAYRMDPNPQATADIRTYPANQNPMQASSKLLLLYYDGPLKILRQRAVMQINDKWMSDWWLADQYSATGFQRERRSNGMWILQSDKVTGTCNENDRTCVWMKDQRESKDWCYAVWIYARERNYWCNLHTMADAREIWV